MPFILALRKRLARSSRRFVLSAAAGGLLTLFVFFFGVAWDSYRATIENTQLSIGNIAALIEQDIARNFELYDLSLQAVIDGITDPEVMAEPKRLRQIALFDRSATAPGLGAMVALDKNGSIFLDSLTAGVREGNFADREYFRIHRESEEDIGLYFSRPFRARLQNSIWSISISRRLTAPDGTFGGIVSGTVKLDYIKGLFDRVALGHHGSISLFRNDGILIVRNIDTQADNQIGMDWRDAPLFQHLDVRRTATFEGERSKDGVARFYAYQRIKGLPLTIAVGLSQAEVMAPFWSKMSMLAAIFAAMAASVLLLVWLLDSELRRRDAATRAAVSLARIDGLTALANRRRFDETLPQEWGRGAREQQPLSLVMIDIDCFKKFNDRYGHPEGDRVLAAVGNAIAESVRRPGDLAARYGGEEFVLLLPNTSEDGVATIAEAVRASVASLGISHADSPHGIVTVSLGAATAVPSADQAPGGLVAAADAALYRAKDRGKNRVVASNVVAASFRGRGEERLAG